MDNETQGRIKRMPTAPNTETSAINPNIYRAAPKTIQLNNRSG